MKKIIHHLRGQSEKTKRKVLHGSTIFFAVIMILLWIYSLGVRFSDEKIEAKIKEDLTPFSTLKDNMISGYKSISE